MDAFGAKQTGANKITVTGTNLPTEKADYVLKLGTATKTLKDVVVNEEKTSAVLTTATSTLMDGTYTVTVGENKAEFTGEEAKVAKITIEPENAIIDASDRKIAYAYYKVYNQFEEDVTELSLGNADVAITGSDNATGSKGKVTFTSTSDYNMNVSQVSLSIVCRTNGVSVTKVLTVGEASKLTNATFEGIYKRNSGTYTKIDSIPEGLNTTGLNDYFLFFTGTDQYDLPYSVANIGTSNLSITLSSATGLTTNGFAPAVEVGGVDYCAVRLAVANANTTLTNGIVTLMGVVLTSGKNFSNEVAVDSAVKIDSIRIFASNSVFGNVDNELDYEILDTNGNSITSIDVLSKLNTPTYLKNFGPLRFVGSKDGSAKLIFTPGSVPGQNGTTVSLSWISPTNKFGYTTVTVRQNQYPKAIIGVDTGLFKASIVATSGGTISLAPGNFIYEDQFGNVMSSDALRNNGTYKIEVTPLTTVPNLAVTTKTAVALTSTAPAITASAIDTSVTNSAKFKAVIQDTNGTELNGSSHEIYLYAVNLDDVSGIKASPYNTKKASTTGASGKAVAFTLSDFGVHGYYGTEIVNLQAGKDYNLVGVTTVPAISAVEGKVTKDASVTVVLKNSKGEELKIPYSYSNKDVAIVSSDAFSWSAPDPQLAANGYVSLPANGTINAVSMGALTYTKDLYGGSNKNSVTKVADSEVSDCTTPRVTFSNLPSNTDLYTISNNGTSSASLKFNTPGWHTVRVKYTWNDGFVYETSMTFDASSVTTAQ